MAPTIFSHPDRKPPKFRPLKAFRHFRKLIQDKEDTEQVFHIFENLPRKGFMDDARAFVTSDFGQKLMEREPYLPDLLDDHAWIDALPEGSVGHAYVTFMRREGLSAAGLVAESEKMGRPQYDDQVQWYSNRLRDTHDLFHVLTGYNRDALGEASLLAFTYSQNPGLGVIFISFMGCRTIAKHAPKGARVMDCFWEGKRNGAAAQKIIQQDIIALMHEPLDAARQRLGIAQPVIYQETLELLEQHGYTPSLQPQQMDAEPAAA